MSGLYPNCRLDFKKEKDVMYEATLRYQNFIPLSFHMVAKNMMIVVLDCNCCMIEVCINLVPHVLFVP